MKIFTNKLSLWEARLSRWTCLSMGLLAQPGGRLPLRINFERACFQAPPAGLEPAIFGLEVRRLVH